MHSVELLAESIALAENLGIEVRQEWLNGTIGGACRIGSKWVLFIDLSSPVEEQLEFALTGLVRSGLLSEDTIVSNDLACHFESIASRLHPQKNSHDTSAV